jgi:hypothetical protein
VSFVFDEGVGSLEAAAVLAAIARFEEELTAMHSVPPERPVQSAWVMSGRPRAVGSPFTGESEALDMPTRPSGPVAV